jgi:uncharacterized protein
MSALERVDPVEFARLGNEVQGSVAAGSLERLSEVSRSPGALIRYQVRGYVRRDEKPAIELTVSGSLTVACQRCLGDVEVEIDSNRTLVFLPALGMDQVQDEEEDVDYLPREEAVVPLSLVEEEVLLAMPMAPRHAAGGCETPPAPAGEDGKPSPDLH